MVTDHKLDVLCLTETWLKPDEYIHLNESTPQDYCYKNESRPKGKGGGVATIYSKILKRKALSLDDSGLQEEPPALHPTHHHGQHCFCSGVIQIPGNHHLSGPEVGQSHRLYCEKGPAEAVFPPPSKEVQPATGAPVTVLICHPRDCPVFIYNCLVWFSNQNRHQKTTAYSQDC